LHGGRISVEEPVSRKGSLFRVALPQAAPVGAEVRLGVQESDIEATRQAVGELTTRQRVSQPACEMNLSGLPIILLVEDNPDLNAFVAHTLSAAYHVISAFDGQEGLEKALEVRPDLILSDIMMPRMSGDRLVREIRAHRKLDDVPIILLTAKVDDEMRIKLLKEGAQDYLHKPFDTQMVLAKVERFINDIRRRKETEEALHSLSGSLLEVHDQQRKEIALELHDNTVQCLAALQINLSVARTHAASPTVLRILDHGHALLERCSNDLRTLSYGLHPPLLDNLGLREAIDLHVKNFIRVTGIDLSLDIPVDFGRLPAEIELTTFRVLQEALLDLRCYSDIEKAAVRVFGDECQIELEVIAEGWPAQMHGGQIGMATIGERVRKLGGRIEIACDVGGTALRAFLPLQTPERRLESTKVFDRNMEVVHQLA
jgi:DNA-binding response OmpR family regulator